MGSINEKELSDLIALAYDCGLDNSRWDELISRLVSVVGADTGNLTARSKDGKGIHFRSVIGYDPHYDRLYQQHFKQQDPWVPLSKRLPESRMFRGWEHLDSSEYKKSEYYNDFARHTNGLYLMGSLVRMEDGRLWTIGFTRGENKEPFDKKESEFIELLLPHINRAINLGYLLQQQTEPGEQKLFWPLVSLVDGITWGVLLLDDEAKPVYMNRAAEKLLAKEDGLKICQEKISAILPERDLALQDMIQAAIGYPDDLYKVRIGGTIRINRKKSDYPLIVSASPFRPQHINQAPAGSSVIVVISSPEQYSHPSAEVLRELFGLTKAESRLAVELGKGDTLDQISLRMGIKKSTVRSQLLSIFQKTGSKRQADLVRLFGSCVIATNGMSHFMKTPEKALMAVP